jgi:hypothetical protein
MGEGVERCAWLRRTDQLTFDERPQSSVDVAEGSAFDGR